MFKDKLKELRAKKGISQQELAEKIFVSRSAICKWESGLGIPSDVNLKALCEYFEVDEEWLFDRDDLKEGINITKKENGNKIAIISLGFNILFLVFMFFNLFQKVFVEYENGDYYTSSGWQLFSIIEIIFLILVFVIGINLNAIIGLKNKNKINFSMDAKKMTIIQISSLIVSIVSFIWFFIVLSIRLGHPNDYISKADNKNLVQFFILSFLNTAVILTVLLRKEKPIIIISTIGFVVTTIPFLCEILFFTSFLNDFYNPQGTARALYLIFTFLSAFLCLLISGSTLPITIKSNKQYPRTYNKVLLIIMIIYIVLSILIPTLEVVLNKTLIK